MSNDAVKQEEMIDGLRNRNTLYQRIFAITTAVVTFVGLFYVGYKEHDTEQRFRQIITSSPRLSQTYALEEQIQAIDYQLTNEMVPAIALLNPQNAIHHRYIQLARERTSKMQSLDVLLAQPDVQEVKRRADNIKNNVFYPGNGYTTLMGFLGTGLLMVTIAVFLSMLTYSGPMYEK